MLWQNKTGKISPKHLNQRWLSGAEWQSKIVALAFNLWQQRVTGLSCYSGVFTGLAVTVTHRTSAWSISPHCLLGVHDSLLASSIITFKWKIERFIQMPICHSLKEVRRVFVNIMDATLMWRRPLWVSGCHCCQCIKLPGMKVASDCDSVAAQYLT